MDPIQKADIPATDSTLIPSSKASRWFKDPPVVYAISKIAGFSHWWFIGYNLLTFCLYVAIRAFAPKSFRWLEDAAGAACGVGALAIMTWGVVVLIRLAKFKKRVREHHGLICLNCGYPHGQTSGTLNCPECGYPIDVATDQARWTKYLKGKSWDSSAS